MVKRMRKNIVLIIKSGGENVNKICFTYKTKPNTILNTSLDSGLDMKNIVPITDLQRQAAQILNDLSDDEPVIITQRGRASAVLLSAQHYAQIEKDLKLLDDLELLQMVEEAKQDVQNGNTISHEDVKKRLDFKD